MFGNANRTPPADRRKSARVRFAEPAMPADRLLEALSRQTHVRLVCAPEVREEILLLHVRDRPLLDVMTRIADVAGARWRQVGASWRLERPAEMARAQQERDIQARAAILARSLKQFLAPLGQPWNSDVLRAAIPRYQEQMHTGYTDASVDVLDPVYRAFLRCVSDVSPESIARIPAGGRIVFATDPTPMQKRLGSGAQLALAKLQEEQLLFGTTLRDAGMKPSPENPSLVESDHEDHRVWSRVNVYTVAPVRTLLVIQRQWRTNYEVRLVLLNKQCEAIVNFGLPDHALFLSSPKKRGDFQEQPVGPNQRHDEHLALGSTARRCVPSCLPERATCAHRTRTL